MAFVSLRPGAEVTAEELVEWARERIGGYKYPREVHIVDAVPLTNVGKVDRKALRTQLAAEPRLSSAAIASPNGPARIRTWARPVMSRLLYH